MKAVNSIQEKNEHAFWISAIRVVSMFAIILHNWCSVFLQKAHTDFAKPFLNFFLPFSGSFIQLFFIISGSGLTVWFYRNSTISWSMFLRRHFFKILIPYWLAASLFYLLINYANRPYCFIYNGRRVYHDPVFHDGLFDNIRGHAECSALR
jgi:hypothetical protein